MSSNPILKGVTYRTWKRFGESGEKTWLSLIRKKEEIIIKSTTGSFVMLSKELPIKAY